MERGDYDFKALVAESGIRCQICGAATCARNHGTWYRKRVVDLTTGEDFTNLPILRVKFCGGPTKSLMPAELWRGKSTITSALAAVRHGLEHGTVCTMEKLMQASDGQEDPISECTLRRLTHRVESRLAIIADCLGLSFPATASLATKLKLIPTGPEPLLRFRRQFGFALLDLPPGHSEISRTTVWPRPGPPSPAPPHDPPSEYLPRGTRCGHRHRGRPPDD